MVIKYRFKFYLNIVCDNNKTLWQLEHFKTRRTCYLKKLTYNEDRKAFRINSQWVSRKRLIKFKYEVDEILEDINISSLDRLLSDLKPYSLID